MTTPSSIKLEDIVITPQLEDRPLRVRQHQAEIAALRNLSNVVVEDPAATFQTSVQTALELCGADSCGISIYETTPEGEKVFRWVAVTGVLRDLLHRTTPHDFSPSGVCLDKDAPLLLKRPERVYEYLDVGPPLEEALLVPLRGDEKRLEGTIWALSHNPTHRFDAEDVRTMERISILVSTAVALTRIAEAAKVGEEECHIKFRELDHRIKNTLQISSSILSRHLAKIGDPVARTSIITASRRMMAMGLAHVVRSDVGAEDLLTIVRIACREIFGGDPVHMIDVHGDESIRIPVEKSATIVLVLNELVSNAFNHAFVGELRGRVSISLRRTAANTASLIVSDNGVPVSWVQTETHKPGFGMGIVEDLLRRMNGSLVTDLTNKCFEARFPI